jgi:lysophospholipase L1-like esterase
MAFETFPVAKAIVAFGDSITFMAAPRADRGFPPILDERLFSRGLTVGNNGVSGGGYRNASDAYLFNHQGRGLWGANLLVGVNDIAAGEDAATVFAGINGVVQTWLADGLRVVLSTILPWKNGGGWTAGRQTITEAVNASIMSLATAHPRLRVVDGYSAFGQPDDPALLRVSLQEVVPDSLHLGTYGAQEFARILEPAWFELLATEPTTPTIAYPADAVAQMLAGTIALPNPPGGADVVLVYGADGNLTVGPMRAVEGAVETLAVFVLQGGGFAPQPYMGQAESFHVSRIQVTVRSPIDAFQRGEALARALHARLHVNAPPGYTYALASESDPVYLGTTDGGSHLFTFNADLAHRR